MVQLRRLVTLILLAGTAQCGSTSDAPPGQALLFIDTDAPPASMATEIRGFLTEASVDTVRIDILAPDNSVVSTVEVAAPDESNWPVSFGIRGVSGAAVTRLRLRAFRAQRSSVVTNPDTGAKEFEPIAGYTIDRVLELPVPNEKGVFAFRVVLRSECRGHRPDFIQRTTCVSGDRTNAGFREDIESVPANTVPAREPLWWPSRVQRTPTADPQGPADCENADCPHDSVCVPGGFFMLGNLRVVGFGASKDAVPAHPVVMRPFCIDRTEFTVGRFLASAPPWPDPPAVSEPLCTWTGYENGTPSHPEGAPMNCISQQEANAACKAAGGRLPTEAEWEYVASGLGRGALFPWGDGPPNCDSAVLDQQPTDFVLYPACGDGSIEEVDDFTLDPEADGFWDFVVVWRKSDGRPGAKVWHLGGSMSEWTLDTFARYGETAQPRNCWQREGVFVHPSCALVGDTRSVRGGNFMDTLESSYVALRSSEKKTASSEFIGFRCVYPASGEDPVRYLEALGDEVPVPTEPRDGGAGP